MSLTKTGFALTFTQPVKKTEAAKVANYSLRHFELRWHAGYNTGPGNAKQVIPKSATVSADGREVRLELPELLKEKIYELRLTNLNAADGTPLAHPTAFYTLNRLRKN